MKEKGKFLYEYKITEEEFKAADISWETLEKIYDNYQEKYYDIHKKAGEELFEEIFQKPKDLGLHSLYWRMKEPEHLIAKIIRKRKDNYKKYKDINEKNYWKIVRDLVGFRGLLAFKEDWPSVHERILKEFTDDPSLYIDDDDYTKFDSGQDCYLAEPTRAHVREGDNKVVYRNYLGSENIVSKQNYRSIHYIIKYHGVCVELQIRTLFEEALAEMDHKVRYPLYAADEKLNRYSGIMNHLVGVADELGSFYFELYKEAEERASK